MADLNATAQTLRARIEEADHLAAYYREQETSEGRKAVELSRQLAHLPCHIERSDQELLIHLGIMHHTNAGIRWTRAMLDEAHERARRNGQ